jgi:predicted nucleotidyltransferase
VDRDTTVSILRQHLEDIRRLGVASLALFGSVARGEAGVQSDVDVLVEFAERPTFDGYMDLKFFLEDLLGRPVDVVTMDSLKPRLKAAVEREAVRVA